MWSNFQNSRTCIFLEVEINSIATKRSGFVITESPERSSASLPDTAITVLDGKIPTLIAPNPSQQRQEKDALVDAASRGDRRALGELLCKHDVQIRRICRRLCQDSDEMHDVLQETMLGIVQHISSFRGESSFTTWVFTIARTCRNRRIRRKQLYRDFEHSFDENSAICGARVDRYISMEDRIDHSKLERAYHHALDRLTQLDREVLVLRDIEGATAIETANCLMLTVPAAKTRLHRARRLVRRRLALFCNATFLSRTFQIVCLHIAC